MDQSKILRIRHMRLFFCKEFHERNPDIQKKEGTAIVVIGSTASLYGYCECINTTKKAHTHL